MLKLWDFALSLIRDNRIKGPETVIASYCIAIEKSIDLNPRKYYACSIVPGLIKA